MIGVSIGQYECRHLLGQGGTGAVYLAIHRVLGTPRAVKVLLPEWTRYPEVVERFINEARAAAAIRHRNIIGVHDCGRLASGEWYILLDYCEGATLARVLRDPGGPMRPLQLVHILAEVANGLTAAHTHGIIHRDLKPDNLHLADRDGDPHHVTILDFGVAKLGEPPRPSPAGRALRALRSRASSTGALVGTPAYMAPEQLRGEAVDPTADVFALGVIAYQLASGGLLPFQRDESARDYLRLSPVELHRRITELGPVPLARRAQALRQQRCAGSDLALAPPCDLDAWTATISAALAADPRDRPESPRALALALAAATPSDGMAPDGLSVVRAYACELLEADPREPTVRAAAVRLSPAPPAPARRYQIVRRIGAGGMAEVFEGRIQGAEGFARPVAIKRVRPELSRRPGFADAFIEEARLTSRLDHPNLVSVIDFDRDEQGRLFLVMEHVPGVDLATLLRAGALPPPIAVYIAIEILRGLAFAHDLPTAGDRPALRGIIHRDLSPHNVLLSRAGLVKLSDFGIARPLEGAALPVATLSGKPAYMSPEQVRLEPIDERSDLFSVGIILWEALSGRRPFSGTDKEILAQVSLKEVPPVGAAPQVLSPELEAALRKLLAREPARRFSSAREALDGLLACSESPRDGDRRLAALLRDRRSSGVHEEGTASGPSAASAPNPGASASASAPREGTAVPGATVPSVPRSNTSRRGLAVPATAGILLVTALALASRATPAPAAAEPSAAGASGDTRPDRDDHPGDKTTAGDPAGNVRRPAPGPAPTPARLSSIAAHHLGDTQPLPTAPRLPAPDPGAAAVRRPRAGGAAPAAPPTNVDAAPGTLTIAARPWAAVWIDGKPHGETPVQVRLAPGRHRVQLAHPRRSQTTTVIITAARETLLEADL